MTTTNSITDRNLHHDLQHLTDLLPEAAALVRHCSPEGASNPAPAGAKGGASRPFFWLPQALERPIESKTTVSTQVKQVEIFTRVGCKPRPARVSGPNTGNTGKSSAGVQEQKRF